MVRHDLFTIYLLNVMGLCRSIETINSFDYKGPLRYSKCPSFTDRKKFQRLVTVVVLCRTKKYDKMQNGAILFIDHPFCFVFKLLQRSV